MNNDIDFHRDDGHVSRKQIRIVYRTKYFDNNYYIICTSISNPSLFQIRDRGEELFEKALFKVGEEDYFLVKKMETFNDETIALRQTTSKYESTIISYPTMSISNGQQYNEENGTKDFPSTLKVNNDHEGMLTIELDHIKKSAHQKFTFVYNPIKDDDKLIITIGRSANSDIILNEDFISKYHCQIVYERAKNKWFLMEKAVKYQENYSQNGTFIFLKDYNQYKNKQPSNAFLIKTGMQIWIEKTIFEATVVDNLIKNK